MFNNLLNSLISAAQPITQGIAGLFGQRQPQQNSTPLIGPQSRQTFTSGIGPQSTNYGQLLPAQPQRTTTLPAYDPRLDADYGEGGGGYSSSYQPEAQTDPAQDFISRIYDTITRPFVEQQQRAADFDKNNPFAFDEALARSSSEERFNPYYQAELGDFLTGVERTRSRGKQDEEKLRRDLEVSSDLAIGREKRDLQETLRSSEEGFAGSGIFMSGERLRSSGRQEVRSEEGITDLQNKVGDQIGTSNVRQSRLMEDLLSQERTGTRKLGAAKETDILTDIEQQRQEALKRRELARSNYIGIPGGGGISSIGLS